MLDLRISHPGQVPLLAIELARLDILLRWDLEPAIRQSDLGRCYSRAGEYYTADEESLHNEDRGLFYDMEMNTKETCERILNYMLALTSLTDRVLQLFCASVHLAAAHHAGQAHFHHA